MILIGVVVGRLQGNPYQTTRKGMTKVNRGAFRRHLAYQCGKLPKSPHQLHRDLDHQNTEKTHTIQTEDVTKNLMQKKTEEMTMKDPHTILIDTISIRIANKGLGMTTIAGMTIRVIAVKAGGKRKAILPGGGGHMDIGEGTKVMGLGTVNTEVLHRITTENPQMPTQGAKSNL